MSENYEPLSNFDAAILGIEDKTNLMMIAGLLTFARPVDVARLKRVLTERWLPWRRMRQRVIRPDLPLARAYWEDDPVFNLNTHVRRIALPAPGDRATLQEVVGDLVSMPLDYSKPLWQFHVIENYGSGGALLLRIHHAIADGVALAELMIHLSDETPQAAGKTAVSPPTAPFPNGQLPEASTELGRQIGLAAYFGRRVARRLAIAGLDVLSDPDKGQALFDKGLAQAQSALQLVAKATEPEAILDQPLGVRKQVAWSRPLPLAQIKQLQASWGGTLNDLMVTALIGGLRRYMLAADQPVNGVTFRAAIPVSLRPRNESAHLGNRFGVLFLAAPLAMANPQERLAEVRARLDALKQSPEAQTSYHLISALGFAPPAVQQAVVRQFSGLASAVITNVPGPQGSRYLAGQPIEEVMFWAPQPGRAGLAVSIYSFAGQVSVGVLSDTRVMAEPDLFITHFEAEYGAMVALLDGREP